LNKTKVWMVAAALAALVSLEPKASFADDAAETAALRERIVRLEVEVAWHEKIVGIAAVVIGVLVVAFFWKARDAVSKRGLPGLVDEAIGALLKKDESALVRGFEDLKSEMSKRILARERVIALIGMHDKDLVENHLKRLGFHRFVNELAGADAVVVLGIDRCRMEWQKVEQEAKKKKRPALPVVLYTGEERIKKEEGILERLSDVSLAVFANTPVTAAQHAATLLMLTG